MEKEIKDPFQFLSEGAIQMGIPLNPRQITDFAIYLNELELWGKKINLFRRKNQKEIIIKDFLDSLSIAKYPEKSSSIMDYGSGAGFPGIPLKIVREDLNIVLWEATKKKVYFLRNAIRKLKLQNIEAYWTEDPILKRKDLSSFFDLVVSRAVGSISQIAQETYSYLKNGGILLAMKGKRGAEEVQTHSMQIEDLGFEVAFIEKAQIPYLGQERLIIGLKKCKIN